MTRVHSGEQPTTALNLNLVLVRPTTFSTGNSTQQYILNLNLVPVQLSHLLNLNLAIKVPGTAVLSSRTGTGTAGSDVHSSMSNTLNFLSNTLN